MEVEEETMEQGFSQLEDRYHAILGVYALHTETGETIASNEEDRFAYASTHKALSVGVLLQQHSLEELDKRVHYNEKDLVTYSPITEQHVETGMTLKELSDASIRFSDNPAANFIFNEIGGPEGFKHALQDMGDQVTEPKRWETELNHWAPGEVSDTSTAKALVETLHGVALGDELDEEKQDLFTDWLVHNTTGDTLIRAGVPKGWQAGDKTGSAVYGTRNDIGIIWPPDHAPVVLAVLSHTDEEDGEVDDHLIADATKEVLILLGLE
ncbi:beta-lactamase class A [Bacillus sp. JCM 19047]|nr:beta-lactamase class A [Bacillus sp. JCM 19047]